MSTPNPEKPISISLVRKPSATDAAVSSAGASTNATGETVVLPPRPLTASERFTRTMTQISVGAPIVLASLGLIGWSLLIRLPAHPIIAQARALSTTSQSSSNSVSNEQLGDLKSRANTALTFALHSVDELPNWISVLEQKARANGFTAELATRTPFPPVSTLPELKRHPIVVRLDNAADHNGSAFNRVLAWLEQVRQLPIRVDVVSVALQSPGDGVTSATIELHLFTLQQDAKAPAK